MDRGFPPDWMWSEAFALLARAERLHREVFRPVGSATQAPAWEPPVDILETERELLVIVALPGVEADQVEAAIVDGDLAIAGTRILPRELQSAVIHRLELPQGRFERLLTETCKAPFHDAMKYEGAQTIEMSFSVLGQVAMRELMSHPEVSKGFGELEGFISTDKIAQAAEDR